MPFPAPRPALSRRRLLALGGGGALAVMTGCTSVLGSANPSGEEDQTGSAEQARCVTRDSLASHRSLNGAPLVYTPTGKTATFWFDPGFFGQLETWADTLSETLSQKVSRWGTYGSWTNGGSTCDSWHNSGRAFDLASLRLEDDSVVSCRYDQWRTASPARVEQSRRAYWILAAGLHQHFAYVLTYLYNAQHANHIHVDNGRSGSELSQLSTRSRVQVQAVQAISSYLWDQPVELTGRWDTTTRRASRQVLDQLGRSGDLNDSTDNWHAFLAASAGLPRN